ncbi:MAG: domain, G-beta repeat [Gemmataceae bacterium]|nr:domain, G-beta repeat [Gemmataceae bacterium]
MPPEPIDPTTTRLERELKHGSPLIGCRFDPSGRFLFASAQDNTIQRFDLLTGAKAAFTGHQSWVRGMAVLGTAAPGEVAAWERRSTALHAATGFGAVALPAPPPRPFTLISADYHGQLLWWAGDSDAAKPVRTVHAHDGWVRAVAVSPDGHVLASCGNDNAVKLWTAADGKPVRTLEGHTSHVYNVAFHPDGTRLASADLKGVVKDWDLKTATCARELDAKVLHKYDPSFMADIGGARAMAFDATGTRLACGGITNVSNAFAGVGNPLVVLFDWKAGTSKQLKAKEAFQGTMWGVGFHPAGYVIGAAGGNGGRLLFWKGDETTSSHAVTVPASTRDLALDPTGRRLAVAGANGSAMVYAIGAGGK